MNRPEIIALAIIAITIFSLVKWGGVQIWQLLLILVAVVALEAYVPQVPHLVAASISFLTAHISALIHR